MPSEVLVTTIISFPTVKSALLLLLDIIIIMEFIKRLYIAVLSALQCKKGQKNIIKHKLTYNPTVHILKRKEKKTKNKNKNKYDETKCHIPF